MMLPNARAFVVLGLPALLGCATLFASKSTEVSMNSNPVGAAVIVDGNQVGTTPMTVNLTHKAEHSVVFRMAGRQDVTCLINRKIGAGWVILDVLGGLVPIIIDAATGSWYSLDSNTCNLTLPSSESYETREGYEGVW